MNGETNFTNGLTGDTITANKFYGDGSNVSGVVGLNYSELGFTVVSLPTGINQDVVLPYNAEVTYPTELVINGDYVVTIPFGTTLTIV